MLHILELGIYCVLACRNVQDKGYRSGQIAGGQLGGLEVH